jgi:Asp-tRNA(Asn)/Glu-tRNA(Gln) amidotransferase A subunit family amidase
VKRVAALPDFEAIAARHLDLMAAEAAQTHATWFERYAARYDPRTAALIARGREVREDAVAAARSGRVAARAALMALMDEHQLDLWLAPPAPGAAPEGLDSTGDPVMNLPWTYAGLPVVSIPTGANAAGLPLGTQLAGRWYADENLLWWAEMIAGVLPGPASTG